MRKSPPLILLALTAALGAGALVTTSLAAPGTPAKPAPAKPAPASSAQDAAVANCLTFLNAPIDPKGVSDLVADQRHFVDACKGIVADTSCRQAWDSAATAAAGDPTVFFTKMAEGCRLAYCPRLPDHPAACDGKSPSMAASAELFGMILNLDLGPEKRGKVAAAFLDRARRVNIAPINIAPSDVAELRCTPKVASVALVKRGVWIGIVKGDRCFVPRRNGALDLAALDAALDAAHDAACTTALEIAAAPGLTYQDLALGMDHGIQAGFSDVGLTDPKGLSIAFSDHRTDEKKAAAHCAAPTAKAAPVEKPPAPEPALPAPAKPQGSKDEFADVPVIVIMPTGLTLAGQSLATMKELVTAKGPLPKLVAALRALPKSSPATEGLAIVQADEHTDVLAITRAVQSAKDAGFDKLLFAVKNK
jgi:biopolymer transport protein ExbD